MGIAIEFEVPELLTGSGPSSTLQVSQLLDKEDYFDDQRRQLLLLVFASDRPSLLKILLRSLMDVKVDGSFERHAFSLDGSLSSVVRGTCSIALIVREARTEFAAQVKVSDDRLMAAIESSVKHAIPDAQALVMPIVKPSGGIFRKRRLFTEFRFGVQPGQEGLLAKAACDFSAALGKLGNPIAYLFFPDQWLSHGGQKVWLRIGLGQPSSIGDLVQVDLEALAIAKSLDLELSKYDASMPGPAMSTQFRSIRNGAQLRLPESDAPVESVDVVFVAEVARPGLVASWLSLTNVLIGGSMAVLAGHTLASWVLPSGSGETFAKAIRSASSDAVVHVLSISPNITTKPSSHLWVAWRCKDSPGVLLQILEAVQSAIPSSQPLTANYEISRVLESGETCAGKMRFLVPETSEVELSQLKLVIEKSLEPFLVGWTPDDPAWLERSVLVEHQEPGEAPWASLAVR